MVWLFCVRTISLLTPERRYLPGSLVVLSMISHSSGMSLGCCCSIIKLYPTLCNSMDCSMPGSPFLHYLSEFAQTHVHWVGDASNHLIFCHPLLLRLQFFPVSGSFLMSWLFTWGSQSIGAFASASIPPLNIQGWFPLELIGLISVQPKEHSRVFSSTTIRKHQFFGTQPCL